MRSGEVRHRTRPSERGFTLIELMVVVVIITVLVLVAIPAFFGARTRAQDRAAQSSARNALTAAKIVYSDHQDYAWAVKTVSNDPLKAVEPRLTYELPGTASTGPNDVSGDSSGATLWAAAVLSASGTCFTIKDDTSAVSAGTTFGTTATATDCTGTWALSNTTAASW